MHSLGNKQDSDHFYLHTDISEVAEEMVFSLQLPEGLVMV